MYKFLFSLYLNMNLPALVCIEATVRRIGCRAGQTAVPWAVAGACTWTGVEDPDTMLKELALGDRAQGVSDRLPDLQWHTQPAVCFRSRPSECCLAIIPTLLASTAAPGALVIKCRWERCCCGCMCRCDQGLEWSALPVGAVDSLPLACEKSRQLFGSGYSLCHCCGQRDFQGYDRRFILLNIQNQSSQWLYIFASRTMHTSVSSL